MMEKSVERLEFLFDEGQIELTDRYKDETTGGCVEIAYGKVSGMPVWAFSQEVSEKSGAFGTAHGKKIIKVYENALKTGCPAVGIYDSFGGAVLEGNDTLEAYGSEIKAANKLSGIAPQISVITGSCTGSMALVALSADFVIMSENANISLSADKAFSAEKAAEEGIADIVAADEEDALEKARAILERLCANNISGFPVYDDFEENPAVNVPEDIFDAGSVIALKEKFGKNAVCGIAGLKGESVGFVKAFGKLDGDCCDKIAKFVGFCDCFGLPLVTFADAEGFCGDCVKSAAKLTGAYAGSTNVKIALITGKSVGAAFTALAGKSSGNDMVFAYEDALIAPLDISAAAEIVYGDEISEAFCREDAENKYIENYACAQKALSGGHIDAITDSAGAREKIISAIDTFYGKRSEKLPKKHTNILM